MWHRLERLRVVSPLSAKKIKFYSMNEIETQTGLWLQQTGSIMTGKATTRYSKKSKDIIMQPVYRREYVHS